MFVLYEAGAPADLTTAPCGYGSRRSPGRQSSAPVSWSCAKAEKLRLKGAGHFLEHRAMSPQIMPSDTELRSNRAEEALALEEDARLRNDIRLLGRILGDTVRDQEGADVFDLVERIRQTSIRFHRDDDRPARRNVERILGILPLSWTWGIVPRFSCYS